MFYAVVRDARCGFRDEPALFGRVFATPAVDVTSLFLRRV